MGKVGGRKKEMIFSLMVARRLQAAGLGGGRRRLEAVWNSICQPAALKWPWAATFIVRPREN